MNGSFFEEENWAITPRRAEQEEQYTNRSSVIRRYIRTMSIYTLKSRRISQLCSDINELGEVSGKPKGVNNDGNKTSNRKNC